MTTTLTSTTTVVAPRLRTAIDARPPCQLWRPPAPAAPDQPPLLGELDLAPAPAPTGRPGEPDVRGWSATLAQAIVQVVRGQRPIAQLIRWVDEEPLAELALRQRQAGRHRANEPAVLRSVRVQHPVSGVTEVCALLEWGRRTVPLAFRLERCGTHWLCTAVELGPLPSTSQPGRAWR